MALEQYAYLAEILGVIIVVVTLIYLTIQVRQGTELLRSEARQAQVSNDMNTVFKILEHPELGQTYSTEEQVGFEDNVRLSFWIIASMRAREHEWLQYQAGSLDEDTWRSFRDVIFFTLGTARARRHWEFVKSPLNPGFVEMVDEMIEGAPLTKLWEDIRAVA